MNNRKNNVKLSALFVGAALVSSFGSWLIQPVQAESKGNSKAESKTESKAESKEQEPVVKMNPYGVKDAQASRTEAEDVLDVLQIMGKAYATGDIQGYIKHVDNNASVFDEEKNRMVKGKEAILAALTEKFAKDKKSDSDRILSYTIDQPYVKVNGETAVVTYRVIEKVAAGKHEKTLEGSMSDVFQKEDGHWLKVHQTAVWKRVK